MFGAVGVRAFWWTRQQCPRAAPLAWSRWRRGGRLRGGRHSDLDGSGPFAARGEGQPTASELAFCWVNLAGFVLNRGTYAVLVTIVPACAAEPVWTVAAGAIAGMFLNFSLSRSLVFH